VQEQAGEAGRKREIEIEIEREGEEGGLGAVQRIRNSSGSVGTTRPTPASFPRRR